jgi:hypothetical protein
MRAPFARTPLSGSYYFKDYEMKFSLYILKNKPLCQDVIEFYSLNTKPLFRGFFWKIPGWNTYEFQGEIFNF